MSSGVELLVIPLAFAIGGAAKALSAYQDRRVETAARVERSRVDYQALLRRVDEARGRYGPAVSAVERIDERDFRAGDPAVVERVRQLLADAEPRLRTELARAGTASLVAGLNATLGPAARPTAPTGPDPVAATVERVLGRLETAVPGPVRAALEVRAANVLASPPGRKDLLLGDLREGVQRANEDLLARRARLADLHERLDRYAGDPVDAVRRRLHALGDDPHPDWPALTAAVDSAIDRTVTEAVSRHTARAVREALEEVGCEVEGDFDVLLVSDGVAHVRPADWSDLAVRVDRRGETDLSFSVIATGDAALDEAAEQRWCGTVDELLPALAVRGVRPELRGRTEPGTRPAEQVDAAAFPFDRDGEPARRRRPAEQARAREARR